MWCHLCKTHVGSGEKALKRHKKFHQPTHVDGRPVEGAFDEVEPEDFQ